uniref:Uncharacterized protein n=1 Tax=Lygus hesperus TaxID=30085 RepID=A0A0A9Z5U7_LYGHE
MNIEKNITINGESITNDSIVDNNKRMDKNDDMNNKVDTIDKMYEMDEMNKMYEMNKVYEVDKDSINNDELDILYNKEIDESGMKNDSMLNILCNKALQKTQYR